MPHPPAQPKIYHIVHVDRLPSIIADRRLWSDATSVGCTYTGTTIGIALFERAKAGEVTAACLVRDRVLGITPFEAWQSRRSFEREDSLSRVQGQDPFVRTSRNPNEEVGRLGHAGRRRGGLARDWSFHVRDHIAVLCSLKSVNRVANIFRASELARPVAL